MSLPEVWMARDFKRLRDSSFSITGVFGILNFLYSGRKSCDSGLQAIFDVVPRRPVVLVSDGKR
jgi:hypothetical protein